MITREAILVICQDFPAGLSEELKEMHYQRSTRALISLLYAHPEYPFCLALCREEAEWLMVNHGEIITILYELTFSRRQLEILGGPFDFPFFALIANTDRMGQVEANTVWVRNTTKRKPHGAFFPYGLWEPTFPSWLESYGLDYTFVCESLFSDAGAAVYNMPHWVEDMGKKILVFPYFLLNDKEKPADYVNRLVKVKGNDHSVFSFVFQQGSVEWLETFLHELRLKGIHFIHPVHYLKKQNRMLFPSIYLPASSAAVLGSDESFYRNYIFGIREAALLYARSLYSSLMARQIKQDKSQKRAALRAVWSGQNHQFYWKSRFGGITHPVMRDYACRMFLQAEQIAYTAGSFNYGLLRTDFNMDGSDEVLYRSAVYNAFTQDEGGVLFQLDFIPAEKALLNIYHDNPRCIKRAFHDIILPFEAEYEAWAQDFPAEGSFGNALYELIDVKKESESLTYFIEKPFEGTLFSVNKVYQYHHDEFSVSYTLMNRGLAPLHKRFCHEYNFSFSLSSRILVNGGLWESHEARDVKQLTVIDDEEQLEMTFLFSEGCTLWQRKLYTLVNNNESYEEIYQGMAFLVSQPFTILPHQQINFAVSVKFRALS
jgi:hypothetical protein